MTGLEVTGLTVRFGALEAVRDVDLTVATGEVVCLLGPSGCGKSTLLRAVAGLEAPTTGRITWDGADLAGEPPHRRRFGLMFQDYALFPHLDVAANVSFGLRMQARATDDVVSRTAEVLALVGMDGAGTRSVGNLSGGEQQRVALARALAPEPRLLLLDEPLGSLDRTLRERLLVELATLLDRLGTTALHVTHDQEEAFSLGDRVAVMDAGRIVQVGSPAEVWRSPASAFVARFLGFTVVEATVADGVLRSALGQLPPPADIAEGDASIVLRPDAVRLDPSGALTGRVLTNTFRGEHVLVRVDTAAGPLEATARGTDPPAPGTTVAMTVETSLLSVLPSRSP
ncbi:MAG: ABC transporter ATP-binding protein [Acidimicrobiales bacterium]